MSGVNVNISVSNLVQVDRYQSDVTRNPVVFQDQNADMARSEAAKRVMMPVEPDPTEGKIIDSDNKKEEPGRKQKKRKPSEKKEKKQDGRRSRRDRGYMVDIQA